VTSTRALRYDVEHRTRYEYSCSVRGCLLLLCLQPARTPGQKVRRFEIETIPAASLSPERDCFGNRRHVLNVHRRHGELVITSRFRAELEEMPAAETVGGWEEVRSRRLLPDYWHFVEPSALARSSRALEQFVRDEGFHPGNGPMESLVRLSDGIRERFEYEPGSTAADSPIEYLLESGRGVCQDYAHLMIAIARSWGIPSRYVSGYLHDTGRPGERVTAGASHAWVECWLPGPGWVGFDPTNTTFSDQRHIRVAAGRDYADVSPTRGVFQGAGDARIAVDVIVNAVDRARLGGRNRNGRQRT
jgi:transglutaminase-like putative cysteine protease